MTNVILQYTKKSFIFTLQLAHFKHWDHYFHFNSVNLQLSTMIGIKKKETIKKKQPILLYT